MGAASDEIMGMLIAEGKDHIDEKQEEEKKTAEEAADKKKELEEKLQARKDEKNEQEELTKNIVDTSRWYRQRSSGPAGDQGYDEQIKTGRR